ncbi:phosphoserine transaminase [Campylobacter upsaliensis]|uniref:phosphoserine transaminase n=1 Tax=Campylobacter upsaliensis TaxID=28080 RepID=UPI00004B2CDA|nr:phosphoserine transaminase [Campylobacter upsaliensis]EAL52441.1 phosphoserine aminotransferase [Campylobacter upsaliensis RM3195]MCR2108009.1 phosphoserine transaminase [Campylobacter upsaliensis]MCR2113314.1 phosphoserine transaminase [Campylobacter upsaliensis]MCR2114868.1 phosphoserine transaminase [Campylobacter upsaliensis]MCR2120419.1 phosphoserine transaminase [Campylobacter upsaliensis]
MRKINFSAGPSTLPLELLKEAQEELCDYKGLGYSIMEISHRTKIFEEVHFGAMQKAKELYGLNDEYEVLFLQGGASLQFAMIPMNLAMGGVCEYANTGVWTKKAIKEAQILGVNVKVVASSEEEKFSYIPKVEFSDKADYAYVCSNNTIYGTQYHHYPKSKSPLIVDASSDFFSRKVDFSNIALFYGGVQKNAGISGLSCLFIRKDMLERSEEKNIPSMLKYAIHAENNSLFNTPATFAIYMFNLEMEWLLKLGGLDAIHQKNMQKAHLLYEMIDQSEGFYKGHAKKEDRSLMNVSFSIVKNELENVFVKEAEDAGMIGLKGHRILGGIRASIYNAITLEQVKILCEFMKEFRHKYA